MSQTTRGRKRSTPSLPVAGPMSILCGLPSAPTRFAPIISARADAAVRSSAGHSAWLSIDHTAPRRRSATQRSSTGAAHAYEAQLQEAQPAPWKTPSPTHEGSELRFGAAAVEDRARDPCAGAARGRWEAA